MGLKILGCGNSSFTRANVAVILVSLFFRWLEIPGSPLEVIDAIIWYTGVNFSAPGGGEAWLKRALALIGSTSDEEAVAVVRRRREPLDWDVADQKALRTLRLMTPNEKYALVRGSKMVAVRGSGGSTWSNDTLFELGTEGFYTGNTPAIPRLGVPALKMQDAASGFRPDGEIEIGSTTAWPSLLALASTWDVALAEQVAAAIAAEFRGKGANVLLGPSIQVHRTAWGGRNFEYLSGEDPYLGARLAAAYVQGANSEGVITTAKHWVFGEQETARFTNDVTVDARTAWELYYPPFEAAVEAGVGAFMCSYNHINGTHACTNGALLKRDLKGIMGFRGYVQSDWGATYTHSRAIEHGLDQSMPGDDTVFTNETLASLELSTLDGAVLRILAAIYHSRLDEEPGCAPPDCKAERASYQRTNAHRALADRAAAEAVTLLKNEGTLPLSRAHTRRLAVVGAAAHTGPGGAPASPSYYAGGGSGGVPMGSWVSPLDGILRRAAMEGMLVVASPNSSVPDAVEAAELADLAVVVAGASSTECADRPHLRLQDNADELISAVARRARTVVLMQTPGAILMPWLKEVSAVANLFLAGEATGTAWARVLFGDSPPMGKLPIMFPATEDDAFRPQPKNPVYNEGLFTSYRNPELTAAFPFGHGLSYTYFHYSEPRALGSGKDCPEKICVRLDIRNVGSWAGAEVAQAYAEFSGAGAGTPRRILRGFYKTRVLQPGASEVASFNFTRRDLSIYDVGAGGWVLQYSVRLLVGASSTDIRQRIQLPVS